MDRKFTTEPIVLLSYQSFTRNFRYYFLLSLIFILASTVISFISFLFATKDNFFQGFILGLISIFCYVKMAVMVHRSIILNEYNLNDIFSWSSIEFKFFLWGAGIYLIFTVSGGIIGAAMIAIFYQNNQLVAIIIICFFVLLFVFILIRLSMIFPCVAVGKTATMAKSWEATKSHVISLFIIIYGLPIVVNYPLIFLPSDPIWDMLASFPSVLLTIIGVTMVSHCYHFLIEKSDQTDDTETII